jgi:hypothetical protein
LLTENAQIIRPLVNNYGRRVKLRFENEGGKWWSLRGGAQLRLELEED